MLKIRYDYRLFSLLNLLGAAVLNFMTSYGCRYCWSAEVLFLFTTIEQPYDVMKSKMAAPGNLKAKIGDNQIPFCPILKYYFHVFQRNFKVRLYFQQFNVNLVQEWRFPLTSCGASGALIS